MADTIAKYVVALEAQVSRYTAELEKANRRTEEFHKRQVKAVDGIKKAFVALGGAAVVGQLARFVKQSIDAADQMLELSQSTGVAVETLTGMRLALSQSGVSTEAFAKSLTQLNRWMVKSGLEGKDTLDTFYQLADEFAAMEDGAKKTAIAMEIFGRAGASLIPLLNQGADALRESQELSDKLGTTWSKEAAEAADIFNDKLALMWERAKGLADTIAKNLLPALNKMLPTAKLGEGLDTSNADSVRRRIAELQEQEVFQAGMARGGGSGPIERLRATRDELTKLYAILQKLNAPVDTSKPGLLTATLLAPDVSEATTKAYMALSAELADYRIAEAERVQEAERIATEEAIRRQVQIREAVEEGARVRQEKLEDEIEKALEVSEQYGNNIQRMTEKTTESMRAYADEAARAIQSALADYLFDPFEDGLKGMLMGFIDMLRRMAAEAAAAKILEAIGGSGGWIGAVAGFISGQRADGGPVAGGRAYLVGERGPELFVPGASGAILPNAGGVTITQNIDARGASDPAQTMRAMKIAKDQAKAEMMELMRRGKFA